MSAMSTAPRSTPASVGPGAQNGICLTRRDADHIGVFAVYHGKGDFALFLQLFQILLKKLQPGIPADITDRKYVDLHDNRL